MEKRDWLGFFGVDRETGKVRSFATHFNEKILDYRKTCITDDEIVSFIKRYWNRVDLNSTERQHFLELCIAFSAKYPTEVEQKKFGFAIFLGFCETQEAAKEFIEDLRKQLEDLGRKMMVKVWK